MINVVCGIRSTGRICTDLAAELEAQGHEVKIAYGRESVPMQFQKYAVRIGTDLDIKLHGIRARMFDGCGFGSRRATNHFIKWIEKYDPDVIHLHNLHGYYINVEVLFNYLRACGKKIIWTLHDCWAFTGHAAYCEGADCERWVGGCHDCPKKKDYPVSLTDRSSYNWNRKKDIFSSVPNMTLVTPSVWLARLVSKSFLSFYPVKVINNGVDTSVFHPVDSTTVRSKLKLDDNKKIVLGVAAIWDDRKGLKDFLKLYHLIDYQKYKIVLVGLSKKQRAELPDGIIGIERTNSINELAQLYSLADIYFNPTYEDNYPTTNLEAIACGTPVITYEAGGSGESAELFGSVVPKRDISQVLKKITASQATLRIPIEAIDKTRAMMQYMIIYSMMEQ